MAMMNTVEYAKHRGVTKQSVSKAIKTGRITVNRDDKGMITIDSDVADKEWDQNTSDQRRPVEEIAKEKDKHSLNAVAGSTKYVQARAQRERVQAELARMDLLKKSGRLVRVEEVQAQSFKMARMVRDNLLNVPDRIAHELAAETDTAKIHIILSRAINEALIELAGGPKDE